MSPEVKSQLAAILYPSSHVSFDPVADKLIDHNTVSHYTVSTAPPIAEKGRGAMLSDPTVIILMYFILPLWLAAGFADWLCHRASHIETTTGAKESLLHLLMFAEIGLPLLAAMFLEINGLIIAFMILMFLVHEATALWDVS